MNEFHLFRLLATTSGQLLMRTIGVVFLACAMSSCAMRDPPFRMEQRFAFHSFGFDARSDSPDVEILDFKYGGSNVHGLRGCPRHFAKCERVAQLSHVGGEIEVGDELYVKWRIKSTGEILEDAVPLRTLLPSSMNMQSIYFTVDRDRLFIFLIGPDRLDPSPCSVGDKRTLGSSPRATDRVISMYCHRPIVVLYPEKEALFKRRITEE